MKKELRKYLLDTFGHDCDNLELDVCASANPFLRFDLAGEHEERKDRALQARERASTIFGDLFPDPKKELTVLVYDYLYANEYAPDGALLNHLPEGKFHETYNEIETRLEGDEGDEKVRLVIGKVRVGDIDHQGIFEKTANTEIGLDPALYSRLFFIDTENHAIFYMYDDRGCIIEVRDPEQIRSIHETRKDWMLSDYEEKMEKYLCRK